MSKGGSTQTSTQKVDIPGYIKDQQQFLADKGKTMLGPFLKAPTQAVADFTPDQQAVFDKTRTFTNQALAQAKPLDPSSQAARNAYMNPFENDVLNPTLSRMRDEHAKTVADIGARAAAAGAFGGSRGALQMAQADRSLGEQVAQTTGALKHAGFKDAANLALQASAANNTLLNDDLQRDKAALAALAGTGGAQQAQAQAKLDAPWAALDRLAKITPGTTPSSTTTTSPNNNPSTLQSLLGFGAAVLPALPGMSDERTKTDVQKLGVDPETGVEMAAYRYKGDSKSYPKVVGPASAQQVEKVMPGSTANVSGKKVIKPSALKQLMGVR